MINLVSFIPRAVVQGIPLLFGSTGEIMTEKSGNLNLGIPGVMYVGAISGVMGSFFYEQSVSDASNMNAFLAILIPIVCCLLASLCMGLLYCRRLPFLPPAVISANPFPSRKIQAGSERSSFPMASWLMWPSLSLWSAPMC